MAEERSFLGTGWSFPPEFDKKRKTVNMVSDREDIDQSLHILLSTSLKERVMQPKFGADLQEFVFDAADSGLIIRITDIVRTAILYFETRIELLNLNINTEKAWEGILLIEIEYRIKISNSRFNYVFPFYLQEGVDIRTFLT